MNISEDKKLMDNTIDDLASGKIKSDVLPVLQVVENKRSVKRKESSCSTV